MNAHRFFFSTSIFTNWHENNNRTATKKEQYRLLFIIFIVFEIYKHRWVIRQIASQLIWFFKLKLQQQKKSLYKTLYKSNSKNSVQMKKKKQSKFQKH